MGDGFTSPPRKACCGFFRPGSNPRSWVPEASMLTTRPPKPPQTRYMLNKIKQQFRRLGIPLTATCIRTAREPGHDNGYGPLPEKAGRRRCKRKSSTTAHFRSGVTPYASLCNRHIPNFCLDFHLLTTLRHRGLGRRGTHEILFFPTKSLRIDGMTLKTYQTKIKFSAMRAWR